MTDDLALDAVLMLKVAPLPSQMQYYNQRAFTDPPDHPTCVIPIQYCTIAQQAIDVCGCSLLDKRLNFTCMSEVLFWAFELGCQYANKDGKDDFSVQTVLLHTRDI